MCKKCKYSICGDCYQPSLKNKKIATKLKANDQNMQVPISNDNEEMKIFSDEDDAIDSDDEDIDSEHDDEEKEIILNERSLFRHNASINPGYPSSFHSYSYSNSHQSQFSQSQNTSRSRAKSNDKLSRKKKKTSNKKKVKNGSKKKSKKKKKVLRSAPAQPNNGNTPSLSLSATDSAMTYIDQESMHSSTSFDQFGLESCAPSELTRVPSILTECSICMECDKDSAFLPCGHYTSCEKCAKYIKESGSGMCPICNVKIQSILRIYE